MYYLGNMETTESRVQRDQYFYGYQGYKESNEEHLEIHTNIIIATKNLFQDNNKTIDHRVYFAKSFEVGEIVSS